MMLDGENQCRFKSLKTDFDNIYAKGDNNFPATMNAVLCLLNSHRGHEGQKPPEHQCRDDGEDALVFTQDEGKRSDNHICHQCREKGHISCFCLVEKLKEE